MKTLLQTNIILLASIFIATSACAATTKNCVQIKIENGGGYVLEYKIPVNGCGGAGVISGKIDNSQSTGMINVANGTNISLKAEAGDSTTVSVFGPGTIRCKGTTIIGFKCGYVN
jgi:hypothetical protein